MCLVRQLVMASGLVAALILQNFRNQMKKFEAEQKNIQDAKSKEKAQVKVVTHVMQRRDRYIVHVACAGAGFPHLSWAW